MTNAILEPKPFESSALTQAPASVAEMTPPPAAPVVGIGRINSDGIPKRAITQSTLIQGKKLGLFGKPFHMLRDASFQIGLSLPGKLWYRESPALDAREKATMDILMQGFL